MTRKVNIGGVTIGGGERIAVQSMSTKRLSDVDAAVEETLRVKEAGCDIMRFSVLDEADAKRIGEVKRRTGMPIVADIHFDHRLAIAAIENGADKIRINPGNVGGEDKVREVAAALKARSVPVRVGSNGGSLEKEFVSKYGRNEIALCESALAKVAALEKYGVKDIVISVKSSSVPTMIKAYTYVSKRTDHPLHIGVTEAGTEYDGAIKNAVGIGALLSRGIGDTIRVSLSADPVREVVAAKSILSALELINEGVKVIACPTCGRCEWECMKFASEVTEYVRDVKKPFKIAVMGCVVNGPGEAGDADLGIAGAKDKCVIFKGGKVTEIIEKAAAKEVFFKEIDKCLK